MILKLLDGYSYQSCEHPEWEGSWAKTFVDTVRLYTIPKLAGYRDAPWVLDDGDLIPSRRFHAA